MNVCPIDNEHLEAAKMCKNVYNDSFLRDSDDFVDMGETDVQASIRVLNKTMYVAYRGSSGITDWKMNFKMNLVNYPVTSDKEIHSGFLINWLSVKDTMTEKINKIMQTGKIDRVIFCGHSAGTVCILNAYDMVKDLEERFGVSIRVVTFGAPRLGDIHFKESFEGVIPDCSRIVLDKDIVSRFPIGLFQYGDRYKHVGKPLQLREGTILEKDTSNLEAFSWAFKGIFKKNLGFFSDHEMSNYILEIEKIIESKDSKKKN